ncbi:MAG: molybdenum cofactor biosynthesis protein MoaE [Actinomycetes bacterium]
MGAVLPPADRADWLAITDAPLPVEAATSWVTTPASGAVVTFCGVARDHSVDRPGVRALAYEAYEEAVVRVLGEIAGAARARWPVVERIALLHRTGELAVGDTAVVVAVSSPHRPEAFEAARFCIDTLKASAPIWKREDWSGGSDWGLDAHDVRPVDEVRS